MKHRRLNPIDRKNEILAAALQLARKNGYQHVQLVDVARQASCAPGLVVHYFTTMAKLRRAVMGEAIRCKDLSVLAQGLAARDPRALGLDQETKQAALATLL